MLFDEKTAPGAHHIAQPHLPPSSHLTLPQASPDNASSTTSLVPLSEQATPTEEYDPTSPHPFSAFYLHPTTRTSLEQHKSESKDHLKVYEHDLEAGSQTFSSSELSRPTKGGGGDAGKANTGPKNLCVRRSKRWSPFRYLTKTQILLVKILIAAVIVGAAVGIGIGISKAVGVGVWKNANSRTDISG